MILLRDEDLERSSIVANCRMNRERELAGSNGYERELRLHPVEFLRERARDRDIVRWLDLCCGTGRALLQASESLRREGLGNRTRIVGVDLAERFPATRKRASLRLITASVRDWKPEERFDLISCVHGLHYLGDKLGAIARALGWLVEDGVFVANLDLANLRAEDGSALGRAITKIFRSSRIVYDHRRHLLTGQGPRGVRFPLAYLGADDTAGPNCTGQAAVHSYYRLPGC